LVIFARWRRFASERDFYRLRRRSAAGCLPNSAQPLSVQPTGALQCRSHRVSSFAPGATLLDARKCSYEALEIARQCLPETLSAGGDMDGWLAPPISAGAIAWDGGRRVFVCSSPSTPLG
jgi:hypothetical protein